MKRDSLKDRYIVDQYGYVRDTERGLFRGTQMICKARNIKYAQFIADCINTCHDEALSKEVWDEWIFNKEHKEDDNAS